MPASLEEGWVRATALIQNEAGELGTGFFVARKVDEASLRLFLITNKHVLADTRKHRDGARQIELNLNLRKDGKIVGTKAILPLRLADGNAIWREHEDPDVDVLAIDVTAVKVQVVDMDVKWAGYDGFADPQKIVDHEITMADEVIALGYPLGLKQGDTFLPIAKSGILASKIGERVSDTVQTSGGELHHRNMPAFLVDGAFIPGSSGSPVILKPMVGRVVRRNIVLSPAPSLLLGIISETKYVPVSTLHGERLALPGIALAFDVSTIIDVIESFF
ncbi:MAG TPA: trypsin-like peptidase domain-containing protein [Thermoplasmata archaeon]|nr:trypsin-like peptidase domain-containing protein [Thermoplasmata archaeon]